MTHSLPRSKFLRVTSGHVDKRNYSLPNHWLWFISVSLLLSLRPTPWCGKHKSTEGTVHTNTHTHTQARNNWSSRLSVYLFICSLRPPPFCRTLGYIPLFKTSSIPLFKADYLFADLKLNHCDKLHKQKLFITAPKVHFDIKQYT